MCPVAGVGDGSFAFLFEGVVGKGLAAGVLAEPYRLRGAVGEADHVVFPKEDGEFNSMAN